MVRLQLNHFGSADARTYKGPSGQVYDFYKDIWTEVKEPNDALQFINAENGKAFKVEGVIDKVKTMLQEAANVLNLNKNKEETPPPESGKLEPTAQDIAEADGETAPIDEVRTQTKESLKLLNGKQQIFIIKQVLGDIKIPARESDKINMILDLQAKGHNIAKILEKYIP